MASRLLGSRAPLLWLVLPMMVGIVVARCSDFQAGGLMLGFALIGALVAFVAGNTHPRLWRWAMLATFGAIGSASYTWHRARLATWESLPPREAELSLRIDRVFATDPRKASGLARVVAAEPLLVETVGQFVYYSCALRRPAVAPLRSEVIRVSGVLTPVPASPPADTFAGYLASAGANFQLTRGRLLHQEQPASAYYQWCGRAAEDFRRILGLGIEAKRPALAGLLRAMMLGETRDLTEDQHTIFMQSGTMHLFAISGLNIAVIAGAFEALLRLFRLPAWARFAIGIPLLWTFVDITGAAPSAIRAFAMAAFFQAAFVLHRPTNAFAALVGSAALVLIFAPLQLFSASFLMSYGIVVALLVLGVPLGEAWLEAWSPAKDIPRVTWTRWHCAAEWFWRSLAGAIAIGVSTAVVGLITGVQFFHLLTPGSLVSNLVLIPAAMIVTLGGFASVLCGLLGLTGGAVLCNHASALILLVIEALVRFSVRLPWAYLPAQFRAPWVGWTALSTVIAVLLFGFAVQWRREYGGYWPPFAVLALTLAIGVTYG